MTTATHKQTKGTPVRGVPTGRGGRSQAAFEPGSWRRAAARSREHGATRLELPVVGTVKLPPRNQLAFIGGVGLLAMAGVIDWPVAAVIGLGHLLAGDRSDQAVHDFGEALEQA
ncbi:hypothetical protein SAMN04489712_105134 [Thermomonospora echinospora]|uniref:Uncharacterized protein n=1 Tax=Thermomonospora echinospora TaxID=1992 RepID=A0A1H6A0X3_9ACTN|nr:hypothetical protein SAMN04489712_105134 [Thermomonospora echinospora]